MRLGCGGAAAGKLRAAARRWAGGRGGAADRADDALTQAAALQDHEAAADASELELSPDETGPVGLFLALASQWRIHPAAGVRMGIDYAAIPPTAAMMEVPMTPSLFNDIRAMESAALEAMAARR